MFGRAGLLMAIGIAPRFEASHQGIVCESPGVCLARMMEVNVLLGSEGGWAPHC